MPPELRLHLSNMAVSSPSPIAEFDLFVKVARSKTFPSGNSKNYS
jgi:hypothetical protein